MKREEQQAFRPSRRSALKMLASSVALASSPALSKAEAPKAAAAATAPFSFDGLTAAMKAEAAKPYEPPAEFLPPAMQGLNYDQYRKINFRPDHAVWASDNSPFQIDAFHMGWLFKEAVALYEVEDGKARPIVFGPDDFDYRDLKSAAAIKADPWPGVAGFRIRYPLNSPDVLDELVSFLGASYFRALGRGSVYGLSARGLVIDSWFEGPEEFPRFSAFYFERPNNGDKMTFYAALESPSVAGAYQFDVMPATDGHSDSLFDVTARLFFRKQMKQIGVAPLTSMFLFAANNRSDFDDYREQVHDSSGLRVTYEDGTVLWRPLNNPPILANSYIWAEKPKSFGLFQRERRFSDYQDAEAQYERRPSVEIEPLGDWGQGHVRLIESPIKLEADDNIGAFWIPADPIKAGGSLELKYRMHWGDLPADPKGPLAFVAQTRAGQGGYSGVGQTNPNLRKFVVDFAGGPLAKWNPSTPPDIVATVDGGTVKSSSVERLGANGNWRLALDVEAHGTDVMEIKAYLKGRGKTLTETWIYQWRAASG